MEMMILFALVIMTGVVGLMVLRARDKSKTDQYNNNRYQEFKKEYLRIYNNEDEIKFNDLIICKTDGWDWNSDEFYFENEAQNKRVKMYDIIFDQHSSEFKVYKFKSNK